MHSLYDKDNTARSWSQHIVCSNIFIPIGSTSVDPLTLVKSSHFSSIDGETCTETLSKLSSERFLQVCRYYNDLFEVDPRRWPPRRWSISKPLERCSIQLRGKNVRSSHGWVFVLRIQGVWRSRHGDIVVISWALQDNIHGSNSRTESPSSLNCDRVQVWLNNMQILDWVSKMKHG